MSYEPLGPAFEVPWPGPDGAFTISVTLAAINGVPEPVEIALSSNAGKPVTASAWRTVQVKEVTRQAIAALDPDWLAQYLDTAQADFGWNADGLVDIVARNVANQTALEQWTADGDDARAPTLDDDHYREVAQIAAWARANKLPVYNQLSKRWGRISDATAARWIREARWRGFDESSPTKSGKGKR